METKAQEYLEMCDDPQMMLRVLLANKIVEQQKHIEYLERRLKNDSSTSNKY